MFKVECPGCQAPYQVDERRVPAAGLRMRCPKCGNTFPVNKPGASSPTAIHTGQAPAGAPPPPRRSPIGKGTMIGVAAQSDAPKAGSAPRRDRKFAGTVMGVQPPHRAEPPAARDERESDLPAVLGSSRADLPAAKGPPNRPPPRAKPPLPTRSDEAGLPATRQEKAQAPADLPAARAASKAESLPPIELSLELDDDLPAARVSAPASKGPSPQGSLPTLKAQLGSSPSSDSLPSLKSSSLQPKGNDPFAPPRAPSMPAKGKGPLPSSYNPSVSEFEVADAIEMQEAPSGEADDSFGSEQSDSLDLPSPARHFGKDLESDGLSLDGGAFGEINLPIASDPRSRKPGERDPLGLDSPLDPAFDGLPNVRPSARSAPPLSNPFEQAFSLPELEAQPAAPRSTSFSASFPGFDTAKANTQSDAAPASLSKAAPNSASPPSSGFGELDDSLGDGDFGEGPALEHGPGSRRSKGGEQYGEVDLGGGEGFDDFDAGSTGLDTDDGMEFGAIPQESTSGDGAEGAPAPSSASIPTAKPNQAAGSAAVRPVHLGQAVDVAQDAKKSWAIPLAALLTVGVAGGALALLPDIGPYGIHFFSDVINQGDYERTLAKQHEGVVEARAADTLKASLGALSQMESKRKAMPRFRPLRAYLAFAQYAHILRFGGDSELQAKAKVQLDSVLESVADPAIVEVRAARAAGKGVAGDLEDAREAFERLTASRPKDLELLAAQGEVQLSLDDAKGAKATWQRALELQKSAWTLFGLARAQQELGESEAARASATAVLEKNAEHVGAKLLLAELAWDLKDEARASKFLDEVIAKEGAASRGELLQARTLSAEIHFGRGRLSKAEAEFEAALKLDPKSYRALAGLGDTFFEAGRYTAALARYEAAVSSDDKAIRARLGIARSQLFLEKVADAQAALIALQKQHPKDATVAYWLARSAEVAGKRDIAKDAYEVAIAEGGAGPDAARSYVALAQLLRQEGALDDAAKLLTEASKKLPDSPLLRKALGDVALSQGRYQQALDEFRAARKLDPADVGALFSVGVCQRKLGEFEQALETFEEVAAIDKDLPGLPLERGLLLEQSGKTQEALDEYESALERAPDDPDLMLRVGCARVAARDAKAAQSILVKVLEKRPRLAEAHHCLGRAYFGAEKYVEALQSLRRATELDPNRAEYFVYVAWVANAAGQVALAEQAIDTALSMDQGLGDAYWQKGVLLLRQGAALDAVHSFDKALELRPSRHEVHADLAQAYYQLGDELKALREWEQALQYDDTDPTWQYRYGKLLAARRMNREALPHLQKAIELAEAKEVKPPWLWQAHQLLASTLGPSSAALPHWRKFLEQSPENSPYRDEAKRALARAGQAWAGP